MTSDSGMAVGRARMVTLAQLWSRMPRLMTPGCLLDALELDRDDRLDGLVEVDAEEVDVRDLAADGVTVGALDEDRLRRAVDVDVEECLTGDQDERRSAGETDTVCGS